MRRIVAIAIAGLVAACGGSSTERDVDVRPFDEVQASELTFEADATNPTRGIFRVETTEPMICAIVWGETEDLGRFNNSLDMAGTGIVQHDVVLPDVESGVEYHFVVQGTTADGRLYRSDMGTFIITAPDAAGPTVERGPNLAQGADVVEVSSEFNDAFAAANAVDGDLGTEWSTGGDGDDAFITIDLGEPSTVSGFEFLTRSMTDGSATAESYTVTVDDDETLGPFPAGNAADPMFSASETEGRVFRFDVESSTGGNTGAVEIRMYES